MRWIVRAATVALLIVLAVPAVRHWREHPSAPPRPLRAAFLPPNALAFGAGSDHPFDLAIAPDGRRVVYPATQHGLVGLWLQDLTTNQARALPSTAGAVSPFWSPDGQRIAFFAEGKLRAMDLTSGTVSELADAPTPRGGTWNSAGVIVFAPTPMGP